MNLDKRRQHVTQAVSNLGEHGAHIPVADQIGTDQPGNSFAYIPESNPPIVDESQELDIPMGEAPSLIEPTAVEGDILTEHRVEHPSPLAPQEVEHSRPNQPATEVMPKTLEEKFAVAMNDPEALAQGGAEVTTNVPEVQSSVAAEENPSSIKNEFDSSPPEPTQVPSVPHEHFASQASAAVIEKHGLEDAGFGAEIMEKRQAMMPKPEQKVG